MANAKKCDRCGAYYEKNQKFRLGKTSLDIKDGIMFTGANGSYTDQIDLCDDCIEKLDIFLNGVELAGF